ncbi:MAG: hypothetical protein AB7F22_26740 [Reyranella sp.]|uniref:hypothetical protein n=1 Tax=Reyranella sp. TaxID=1929291 RepID=UPI003D0B5072
MIKLSRAAVSALFAFGLAGAAAGIATPASAAPGQVCYFGECRTSTGPSVRPAPTPASTQSKLVARRGSWSAVLVGERAMIIDEFANGSKFAIVAHPEGKFGLMLMHPEWRLRAGQRAEMSVTIDGEVYKGTAVADDRGILEVDGCSKEMLQKLYRGREGRIEVGNYSFTMTNLGDAKAVIDAVLAHLKVASR